MAVTKLQDFNLSLCDKKNKFVLDTNILYFIHSGYYVPSDTKHAKYSNIIQQILTNGNQLLVSTFCLQELIFGIENKEYKKYCTNNGLNEHIFTKKDFRKNLCLRTAVESKIKVVLTEIKSTYTISDGQITKENIQKLVDDFSKHTYDPIDYLMVKNMLSYSDLTFITDDSDFTNDADIEVLTI